jgi:hypothetical protein
MSQETPFQDPFELLKKMWAPMGLPLGTLAPLLDVNDIEKRIADLKSVETWLSMNLNVLKMTIQGLEMQKATLSAFQAMQPGAGTLPKTDAQPSAGAQPNTGAPPSVADAWWSLLQQVQNPPPAAKPEPKPEKKGK